MVLILRFVPSKTYNWFGAGVTAPNIVIARRLYNDQTSVSDSA